MRVHPLAGFRAVLPSVLFDRRCVHAREVQLVLEGHSDRVQQRQPRLGRLAPRERDRRRDQGEKSTGSNTRR